MAAGPQQLQRSAWCGCIHPVAGDVRRHASRFHVPRHMYRLQQLAGVVRSSSNNNSSNDPSGDFRPQARVSAPPPPAAADHQTAQGTGGSTNSTNGAGSSGNGLPSHASSASNSRSYSDMYRGKNTLYSTWPQQASNSSSSSSNSSSKRPQASTDAAVGVSDAQQASASAAADSPMASVDEALQKAQAALAAAETHLSNMEILQPQLTGRWAKLFSVLKMLAVTTAACGLLVGSHAFGLGWQWVSATLAGIGVAGWGYRSSSLSRSGAIAAAAVVAATFGCSLRFGVVLVAFFVSSSKLTHYKEEMKEDLVPADKRGGQRDWKQVLCNGGVPTILAIAYGAMAGCLDLPMGPLPSVEPWRADILTLLMGGFLGYYACCCGDTWASELGSLSNDQPRLITGLKPVRRGTHGAVTLLGLSASLAGGLFMGLVFYVAAIVSPTLWVFEAQHQAAVAQWRLIPLGLVAGLCGSLLDSVLGALLQFTGYHREKQQLVDAPGPEVTRIAGMPLLTNNLVNLLSASITSALTALCALMMFG